MIAIKAFITFLLKWSPYLPLIFYYYSRLNIYFISKNLLVKQKISDKNENLILYKKRLKTGPKAVKLAKFRQKYAFFAKKMAQKSRIFYSIKKFQERSCYENLCHFFHKSVYFYICHFLTSSTRGKNNAAADYLETRR